MKTIAKHLHMTFALNKGVLLQTDGTHLITNPKALGYAFTKACKRTGVKQSSR